jgi:hypothetical protein
MKGNDVLTKLRRHVEVMRGTNGDDWIARQDVLDLVDTFRPRHIVSEEKRDEKRILAWLNSGGRTA